MPRYWLAQAKCLSHYLSSLTAPSGETNILGERAYQPDKKNLGDGDVMHLTVIDEKGETTALYVPGAFQRGVWRVLDETLTQAEFESETKNCWSTVKNVTVESKMAMPLIGHGKKSLFVYVSFSSKSTKATREFIAMVTEKLGDRVELCEAKYSPESRFVEERGLEFSSWFIAEDLVKPEMLKTHERHEWVCRVVKPLPEGVDPRADPPPLRVLSFDIETCGKVWNENKISMHDDPDCQIYAIALTSHVSHVAKPEESFYLLVRPPKAPPTLTESYLQDNTEFTHVFIVDSEDDLLQKFNDIVHSVAPLFITGHNILNYDLPWILNRGKDDSRRWTRRLCESVTIRSMQRDSGAFGKNDTNEIKCERIILDLLPYMKQNEQKLDDFKLNTIARAKFMPKDGGGRKKVDLRYSEQHRIYTQSNKLEDHLLLATYVYTDADLVQYILVNYSAVPKIIAGSRVAKTPIEKMLGGELKLLVCFAS